MRFPSRHDIVLGTTASPLPYPQFRLSREDQSYHATIWGRTGSGKSKLLQSVFLQHLFKGHGVGLIEPHHDLSWDTLTYLVGKGFFRRPDAFDRLVYLDWGNGSFVPFNVLSGEDPIRVASNAFAAVCRVWPELEEAPLFKRLFSSAVTALAVNRLPITYLYKFLTDGEFRAACMRKVDHELVQDVIASYEQLGRDQVQAAGSTLNRAFALSFTPETELSLGQRENWLDFRKLMDAGKSFIINLGNVHDPEARKLIGALLMMSIEQAALSRTDLLPSVRRPFTLLVDEWPSFAAQDKTIATILSQTRKFNLRLYLAAQSLSQISSERLAGAIENCRLTIAFGLGRDSAEVQAKHIGTADAFAVKEEAHTETQHAQYLSTVEQFESWIQELQNLPARTAYVKLHDKPAVRIKTLHVTQPKVSATEVERILAYYRQRYQRREEEVRRSAEPVQDKEAPAMTAGKDVSSRIPAYSNLFRKPSDD